MHWYEYAAILGYSACVMVTFTLLLRCAATDPGLLRDEPWLVCVCFAAGLLWPIVVVFGVVPKLIADAAEERWGPK